MITCMRCDQAKQPRAFGLTPAGNRRRWCIPCHRAYKVAWKKSEKGQASERAEQARNGGARNRRYREKNRERVRAIGRTASRTYYLKHKEKVLAKSRASRKARPEVYWAGVLVRAMVFFGMLKRGACKSCGETKRVHAHHVDHMKPTQITWLCPTCHGSHHGKQTTRARYAPTREA